VRELGVTVGFVMLVHDPLDRAAAVARHLATQGVPIVIHVDSRVSAGVFRAFRRDLANLPAVRFAARRKCRWGTWSIVEATLVGCRQLLGDFPHVDHVFLTCGTSIPLRPIAELQRFLGSRPDTDFIESVTTEDVAWTIGGLDRERFTLSFPFSWKSQRLLFDLWVLIQRRLGLRRRFPAGIEPHLGSQWWCLSRRTLERIMSDPEGEKYARFFRRVWIPDESYFQTLARRHSLRLESRSLTLAKFDFQGKPHVFYDDHLDLLQRSDRFMARKIWPRAEALYSHFLSSRPPIPRELADPTRIDRLFARALERRTRGRPGLYMQSRFPNGGWENGKTAAPYSIHEGFSDLFEDWEEWLGATPGVRVHGHIFDPERAEFADGQTEFAGALSDIATLRDYNPVAFLTNLVWSTRGEQQCFAFGPSDTQVVADFFASDPNARVFVVSGAWLIPLLRSGLQGGALRKRAAELQAIEVAHIGMLRSPRTNARVRIWTLAEFLDAPGEILRIVQEEVAGPNGNTLMSLPRMVDLAGLLEFVQTLRNDGMLPHIVGDLSQLPEVAKASPVMRRVIH
jgi:hypothetical protein